MCAIFFRQRRIVFAEVLGDFLQPLKHKVCALNADGGLDRLRVLRPPQREVRHQLDACDQSLGFRFQGPELRAQGSEFKVQGSKL